MTTHVTVAGPTLETIVEGLNTNSIGSPEMWVEVKFKVFCGTKQIGQSVDGVVQERVRRTWTVPPEDSDWVRPTPKFFYFASPHIFDRKVVDVNIPNFSSSGRWSGFR